ncbi:unnamed protein product [Symbiodinium natans]|uniref:Uncharacterized protein n=1 Tax=Symbiodinium natans TaxID=878477 RepID=A0A812NWS4_9DINO|nr:unnamed protein product [Symbiodinium natans]
MTFYESMPGHALEVTSASEIFRARSDAASFLRHNQLADPAPSSASQAWRELREGKRSVLQASFDETEKPAQLAQHRTVRAETCMCL